MGSNLGRMLAITLPLAGIGIAAPFLAPALLPAAAGTAGAVGGTAGAVGGTAGSVGAASATPAIAASAPAAVGAAGPAAASSITPATLASGIQGGTSLTSGLLNQAFNQPGMPQMPTIRAPAQTAAPYFSSNEMPSPAGGGLVANIPGPGASSYQGAGMPGNLGMDIAQNLFSDQNPFAQYAMAA